MRPDHRGRVVVGPVVVGPVVAAEEIFERDASAGKNYLIISRRRIRVRKKGAMGREG
jgi:hypothetical protein